MVKAYLMDIREIDDTKTIDEIKKNISNFRLNKYEQYKNKKSALQSLAASFLLNKCLEYFNMKEKYMEYELNEFGKPFFKNYSNLFFNISHSANLCLVCVSNNNIGCDIQIVKELDKKIIEKFLSNDEINFVNNLPIDKKNEKIISFWCIKEAYSKLLGKGLSLDFKNLVLNFECFDFVLKNVNEIYKYCIIDDFNNKINAEIFDEKII